MSAPVVFGRHAKATWHDCSGPKAAPQVLPTLTKFAVVKVPKECTAAAWNSLVIVAGREALVVPTLTVPKLILEGLTTSCSAPSPVGVGVAVGVAVDVAVAGGVGGA